MGESEGPGSKATPSWQLSGASDVSNSTETQQTQSSDRSTPDPRASLISKASKFLDEEDIREASNERKIFFLQTKGLTDQEIDKLLAEKNADAEVAKGVENEEQESTSSGKVAASTQPMDADISDDYIDSESPPSQKQEGPPIITYPEFLLHSQKPPPLVTTSRLLTALYLTSGAAATMYGLGNYIVEPMVESLSAARHSFFENASSNIDLLNEKLGNTVSQIPDSVHGHDESDALDGESVSSDPARFFSRTVATQTSPRVSRSSSSMSLPGKASPSAVATHASHLSRLHELLSGLKDEDREAADPVKNSVKGLKEYLENLPSWGRTGLTGAKVTTNADDGVMKVKAEIKSVKGTLLSARNFPAGITSR